MNRVFKTGVIPSVHLGTISKWLLVVAVLVIAGCNKEPWLYGHFLVVMQPGEIDFSAGVMRSNTLFYFVDDQGTQYELAPIEHDCPLVDKGDVVDAWSIGIYGVRVRRGKEEYAIPLDQRFRVRGEILADGIKLARIEAID